MVSTANKNVIISLLGGFLAGSLIGFPAQAFFLANGRAWSSKIQTPSSFSSSTTRLFAGDGRARNYTWHEEALEIEVSVKVPKQTRAKDILFKATSRSIDLRLSPSSEGEPTVVLLDGSRQTRGRINLDGTFWMISDVDGGSSDHHRVVTVTIEKLHRTPRDDFEVIDYDWKGVYAQEDPDEVEWRQYDEPEPLNVREYAANMGVDIDNINMSMVDKTMFSSGLNLTKSSMDQMKEAGLLQEVTRQADGREFTINEEDGTPQAFTPYGDAVHPDELVDKSVVKPSTTEQSPSIPFLDTNSPWHQTVPVEDAASANITQFQRNMTRAAFAADAAKPRPQQKMSDAAKDPIDNLTKVRLQEILKSQGLPSSGNKKELQERLRSRVNSLLQGKQES
jgi:hypothetical protein